MSAYENGRLITRMFAQIGAAYAAKFGEEGEKGWKGAA